MGDILDDLKRLGAKPTDLEKRRNPSPERETDYFSQIPERYRKVIEELTRSNHSHFKDRFPTHEAFRNAMSHAWLEKKRGFEEEIRRLGFTPIESGTKAGVLEESVIAYITESGSVFFIGPGAFHTPEHQRATGARGAAYSYARIAYRKEPGLMEEGVQESGAFVMKTPRIGEHLEMRGIIEKGTGATRSPRSTHPIMMGMRRDPGTTNAAAVIREARAEVAARFERVDEEAGLVLAPSRKKV